MIFYVGDCVKSLYSHFSRQIYPKCCFTPKSTLNLRLCFSRGGYRERKQYLPFDFINLKFCGTISLNLFKFINLNLKLFYKHLLKSAPCSTNLPLSFLFLRQVSASQHWGALGTRFIQTCMSSRGQQSLEMLIVIFILP